MLWIPALFPPSQLSFYSPHFKSTKQKREKRPFSILKSPTSLSLPPSLPPSVPLSASMEDYKRSQIPAFGYWDFSDDLPITQYFESAAQAGLIRFNHIAGESDLYGYDLKRPTAATITRPKMKESSKRYPQVVSREQKKQGRVCDVIEPAKQTRAPKAVDEDLYKIPPELLHQKPKRKRVVGFWSSCLAPSCIA